MQISLFNTLTHEKELFIPIDSNMVKMYVCGPTVYDTPHIGNARAVVVYDQLYRHLITHYGKDHVLFVRNVTDVDDKINEAAKSRNIPISKLTEEMINFFHEDIAKLNCLAPSVEPHATMHMKEMHEIIQRLIDSNHAYVADDHVYFSVLSDPHYAELSGRKLEDLISGARVEVASSKRHPGDFVLWKPASKDDDPSSVFDSPWGAGRPGWHIECSAMSSKYLGHDFDIHGGGADLMFPHHSNEIAQSTCAFPGTRYARFWVHNGFVTVGGEKMSKSLGNFHTVRDLLEKNIRGEILRLFLLSSHYRKPLDYTSKAIDDAAKALSSFYRASDDNIPASAELPAGFAAALDDDLNTPLAVSYLHEATSLINKFPEDSSLIADLKAMCQHLGLMQSTKAQWFAIDDELKTEIDLLVELRIEAKAERNFAKADMLRDQIVGKGIVIEDKPDGTTKWYKK